MGFELFRGRLRMEWPTFPLGQRAPLSTAVRIGRGLLHPLPRFYDRVTTATTSPDWCLFHSPRGCELHHGHVCHREAQRRSDPQSLSHQRDYSRNLRRTPRINPHPPALPNPPRSASCRSPVLPSAWFLFSRTHLHGSHSRFAVCASRQRLA